MHLQSQPPHTVASPVTGRVSHRLSNLLKHRSLPALFSLSLFALAAPRSAHAGEWVAQCVPESGDSSGEFNQHVYDPASPLVSETYKWDWLSQTYTDAQDDFKNQYPWLTILGYGSLEGSSSLSQRGVGKAETNGKVRVQWIWQKKDNEQSAGPVPPFIIFKVQGSASSAAVSDFNSNDPATAANRDAVRKMVLLQFRCKMPNHKQLKAATIPIPGGTPE